MKTKQQNFESYNEAKALKQLEELYYFYNKGKNDLDSLRRRIRIIELELKEFNEYKRLKK
jgi:hypothetical protein